MKYKVGDRVWWNGLKCEVVKLWGCSVVDGYQILSVKFGTNSQSTTKETSIKPIITLKAELG